MLSRNTRSSSQALKKGAGKLGFLGQKLGVAIWKTTDESDLGEGQTVLPSQGE